MKVKYSANNSGGNWWLTDDDWHALENAGWLVQWITDGRGLGALAWHAERTGLKLRDAVAEWERVTGKSSTDAGCPCCGQPHDFYEYDDDGNMTASGPRAEYVARWEDDA